MASKSILHDLPKAAHLLYKRIRGFHLQSLYLSTWYAAMFPLPKECRSLGILILLYQVVHLLKKLPITFIRKVFHLHKINRIINIFKSSLIIILRVAQVFRPSSIAWTIGVLNSIGFMVLVLIFSRCYFENHRHWINQIVIIRLAFQGRFHQPRISNHYRFWFAFWYLDYSFHILNTGQVLIHKIVVNEVCLLPEQNQFCLKKLLCKSSDLFLTVKVK